MSVTLHETVSHEIITNMLIIRKNSESLKDDPLHIDLILFIAAPLFPIKMYVWASLMISWHSVYQRQPLLFPGTKPYRFDSDALRLSAISYDDVGGLEGKQK